MWLVSIVKIRNAIIKKGIDRSQRNTNRNRPIR